MQKARKQNSKITRRTSPEPLGHDDYEAEAEITVKREESEKVEEDPPMSFCSVSLGLAHVPTLRVLWNIS